MSDVKCPYCGKEQEINHDDGYGFEEDQHHEQMCVCCGKEFMFTTEISYSYQVFCQEDDCDMEESPYAKGLFNCANCDRFEVRE